MRSDTCETERPRRRAGVLLHPTSLPGPDGAGDLGPSARRFVDFLADAGQSLWQVLPLGPTGYGDSPYQALSAYAGNPLLVSLEDLREEGLVEPSDLADRPRFPDAEVDHARAGAWKASVLARAARRFEAAATPAQRADLERFRAEAPWLEDFALFVALKARHDGAAWTRWDPALARREPHALEAAGREHAADVATAIFAQWAFDRQWRRLRARCAGRGIAVLGDLPIYLAHDSADVWARRALFRLDPEGRPTAVAGVPPDYFSATGQLWGNPLYDWAAHAREGYASWIERLRHNLRLFDVVRLDHFRGFEAYWEVPAGAQTAEGGRWVPGPGEGLFRALADAVGPLPLVAENLGVITPPVERLRRRFGFPGMAVLQFAFGTDPQARSFQPHNYERDLVAYTGTHDNDTALGWWRSGAGTGSTRTAADVDRERARARAYLDTDGREMNWTLLRAVYASVAATAIAPLQDLLGLGSDARMNLPGTTSGNWRWRFTDGALAPELAARVRALAALYERSPGSMSSNQ